MRVTECIWAKTFLDVDEIGYAHICCGDYTWAKEFIENMHMERNKTLMQGIACSNHRYVIEI